MNFLLINHSAFLNNYIILYEFNSIYFDSAIKNWMTKLCIKKFKRYKHKNISIKV